MRFVNSPLVFETQLRFPSHERLHIPVVSHFFIIFFTAKSSVFPGRVALQSAAETVFKRRPRRPFSSFRASVYVRTLYVASLGIVPSCSVLFPTTENALRACTVVNIGDHGSVVRTHTQTDGKIRSRVYDVTRTTDARRVDEGRDGGRRK